MTPMMPISQAALDLGLSLPEQRDEELKKKKKDQGTAADQNPAAYGVGMSFAASELFGGTR